jgi:PAS domain S-box-containing protein
MDTTPPNIDEQEPGTANEHSEGQRFYQLLTRDSADNLPRTPSAVERQLFLSDETLRLACEAGGIGVWRRDIETGREVWSAKYYEIYGFAPEIQPCFENWLAAVHPDDRNAILDDHRRMNAEHIVQLQNEFRILHPSGIRWVREIGRNFYDADGRQTEMVGVALDITERKKWEEEMRRALRGKDDFLAMVAHELRNSLSIITGALRLADKKENFRDHADAIVKKNVTLLTQLIGDLLDLTRVTQEKIILNRRPVDLEKVVNETVQQARLVFAEKALRFSITSSRPNLMLTADRYRFEQILINVIHNACKYTSAGGKVDVIINELPGSAVEIRVRDSGIGIPQEALKNIFELYTQVQAGEVQMRKGAVEGLGIGLSVVKRLMDLHGGTVRAHSDGVGKGAEFILTFPSDSPNGDFSA